MGKKRSSKASKQKQVKAQKQHHKMKRKNTSCLSATMVVTSKNKDTSPSSGMSNKKLTGRTSKGGGWQTKRHPNQTSTTATTTNNVTTKKQNEEDVEFRKQLANMEERDYHRQGQKKKKQPITLTESRFALPAPPTTRELVMETAQQLSTWGGMGEKPGANGAAGSTSSLLHYNTTPVRSNLAWATPVTKKSASQNDNNPFAALQDDEEEDDINDSNTATTVLKAVKQKMERTGMWGLSIQAPTFVPPSSTGLSFLEPRTTTNTPVTTPETNTTVAASGNKNISSNLIIPEIDPDL